jgi:hypothetical protein
MREGAGRKIAYAILLLAHASWLAREFAFCKFARCAARGIAAESPQEALMRFRGLAAESPVPGAERRGRAQKHGDKNSLVVSVASFLWTFSFS